MNDPQGLNRPGAMLVAPRNAAANAGSRKSAPDTGSAAPVGPRVKAAASRRDHARGDQRQPPESSHAQTAEPGDAPASPDEQQLPAGRGVLQEVPERRHEPESVVEGERDAEEPVGDDGAGELRGDPGERLRVADRQDDSAEAPTRAEGAV